jgi:hypothetical protein
MSGFLCLVCRAPVCAHSVERIGEAEEKAALLSELLPLAQAAINFDGTADARFDLTEAVRALSPATREAIRRMAEAGARQSEGGKA